MRPTRRHLLLVFVTLPLGGGCDEAGGQTGALATGALFPLEEGRFSAYRHLTAEAYAAFDPAAALDATDLLLTRYTAEGCGGDAWRVELRTGASWESADPAGALYFDPAGGLALCATEDAGGAVVALEPPARLWEDAAPLRDGEPVLSGGWTVTPTVTEDVPTYFGVFPRTVAFGLAGDGVPDGWTLHLADTYGLVLLETDAFTADLVYTR